MLLCACARVRHLKLFKGKIIQWWQVKLRTEGCNPNRAAAAT